jgi:hypothetical protein
VSVEGSTKETSSISAGVAAAAITMQFGISFAPPWPTALQGRQVEWTEQHSAYPKSGNAHTYDLLLAS